MSPVVADRTTARTPPWVPWAVLTGGALAGTMDITYALVAAGMAGISPGRVLRYIASGLLGPAAATGGVPVAALGLALHFVIAFGAALVYTLASLKLPALIRQAYLFGALYGVAVYFFMQQVVLPLSLVRRGTPTLRGTITGIIVHIVCVGLPIALCVRRASRTQR